MKKNKTNSFRFISRKLKRELPIAGLLLCLASAQPVMAEKVERSFISSIEIQQKKTVTGVVLDGQGLGIPGVSVVVKGTTNGSITNIDGYFSIDVERNDAILQYSFIGFKTLEVKAEFGKELSIVMEEDVTGLEEVVVVGYGTQKKNDLTGAISTVNSDELENSSHSDPIQSLSGKVAGLNISTTSFKPGDQAKITVRGENSLTANNKPFIVLDGIPYEGYMTDINPNDIASISVLKDASSAAIYGARGSNGVILITTKKGKKGKPTVTLRSQLSLATVADPVDLLDGAGYIKSRKDFANYRKISYTDPRELLFLNERDNYDNGRTTDWMDEITQVGVSQTYQVSISGGSDNTQYYTSMEFFDQEGVVKGSQFQRINIRSNIDQKITDWLSTGLNLQLTQKKLDGNMPTVDNAFFMSPYGKLYDDNGSYENYPMYPEVFYPNPFANTERKNDNGRKKVIANFNTKVDIPFVQGLSYNFRAGLEYYVVDQGSYYGRNTLSGSKKEGIARISNSFTTDWTFENVVNYSRDFGKHKIAATGLYSRQGHESKSHWVEGRKFVNDATTYNDIESAEDFDRRSGLTESGLASYMGRVNYSFDNRYFLTATGRRDGFTGFGAKNKWGFFPSVALGWNLSNESFFDVSAIDFMKLRVSYGENGNQAINPYKTMDKLSNVQYIYGDGEATANGYLLKQKGNPFLSWETTKSLNLGVDYSLFNKLRGSVEYFSSKTRNLLLTRKIPVMNDGYTSVMDNVGKTKNWGLEFTLNSTNIETENLTWTSNLTFSMNRNEIVELRGDGIDDKANKWFHGEPLRVNYDYVVDGVWQETDDYTAYKAQPGDAKLRDVNENGKIDPDDRQILDSRLPDYIVGLNNTLTYKGFSLSLFVHSVQGGLKRNELLDPQRWLPEKNTNYMDVPYWTPENKNNEFASLGYKNPLRHGFYEDPSFIRIKNISLAYNVPQNLLDKLKLSSARLYGSVNNVHTFTSWTGSDPEANQKASSSTASQVSVYPSARTFTFGLEVSF